MKTKRVGNPLLVVDDDATNRDLLSRRLMRAGYEILTAADAAEALHVLDEAEVDLVLLDSMMPGMTGIDLLQLLRATRNSERLPVIMVTAVNESEKIVEALNLGANDYITKPIDFSVALARIQSQLSRKDAEAALRESEARYALAARGANDGLWDWDLRSGHVYYSPRWHEMLGIGAEESLNRPEDWLDRIHPADREPAEVELRAMIADPGRADLAGEHRLRHEDGTYRWMLIRGHVLRNADGTAIRAAGSMTDVTENKAFDSLTGLPNRVLLTERAGRCLDDLKRGRGNTFALLFLDLDRFKVINDSLGHLVGDELLVAFARRLQGMIRDGCTAVHAGGAHVIARLGGDEFAVLVEDLRDPSHAERVAARIQKIAQAPFLIQGREVFSSVSIGIAVATRDHATPAELLRDADTAMYRAKGLGRARCELFTTEMRTAAMTRLELENDLRRAVEYGQFLLYYQPKIALSDDRVVGFEALLRWEHPQRGIIGPGDFIPIAEETGLILPIGFWVIDEACEQARKWQEEFPADPPLEVSVNLSPKQFHHPDLLAKVGAAIERVGIPPSSIQMEITESVFIESPEDAARILLQLRAIGVGVKLDDFGTGYSSLNYLCQLPCDSLKIDRSFISNMLGDTNALQVVRTIISLAENLGKDVTAEGIETGGQADRLRAFGCDYGQGFYFSRPLPVDKAEEYLKEHLLPGGRAEGDGETGAIA